MRDANVLFAGFGGHGMLLAGKILAYAAVEEGRQVSWLPAYGAEMRGGTANVTVCMSDKEVGSPYIERPDALVAMNTPSLLKFGSKVKSGGFIIINTTLVKDKYTRDDLNILRLDAAEPAIKYSTIKSTNIVLLGAYAGLTQTVSFESVKTAIIKQFASRPKIVDGNTAAFKAGFEIADSFLKKVIIANKNLSLDCNDNIRER